LLPRKSFFKFPENLVEEWPEIFEEMWVTTMPISYLQNLQIEFLDGTIWEFDISKHLENSKEEVLSEKIKDTLFEYRKKIKKIDFKLDTKKLKLDIRQLTDKLIEKQFK